MLVWISAWILLAGFWLVLVGSIDPAECLGGLIAAAIAATGYSVVHQRDDQARVAIRAAWLPLLVRRIPLEVVRDAWRVFATLLALTRGHTVRGHIHRVPFDPGSATAPLAAGRRALVLFGVSLAPNTVAVRIEDRSLVLHQLAPAPLPDDPVWPV
jgi:multisubunit Na+/H+ antiporter MnhE subunit